MTSRCALPVLLVALALVAPACLVTTAQGTTFDCQPVTVTVTHRHRHGADHHPGARHPHPGSYLHAHRRQSWSCTPVPTTTTTTPAPVSPSVSVVSATPENPYSILWTVDVADADSAPSTLSLRWTFSGYSEDRALDPTATPGRYTFRTSFGVYNTGPYTLVVTDGTGRTGSTTYAWTSPPLCPAAAPAVC